MMSDMKNPTQPSPKRRGPARKNALPDTFTVRDMNRQPAAILRACDEHGTVHIRSRDGRSYALSIDAKADIRARGKSFVERHETYRAQLRALGCRPPSKAEMERINRIIAGEE